MEVWVNVENPLHAISWLNMTISGKFRGEQPSGTERYRSQSPSTSSLHIYDSFMIIIHSVILVRQSNIGGTTL